MKRVHMYKLLTVATVVLIVLMCELHPVLVREATVQVQLKQDLSRAKVDGGVHHIYLLVERYMGQQGVGVKALAALQCWASRANLTVAIVEPAMSDSVLTGDIVRTNMSLADLFDLDHFNAMSRQAGYPVVIRKKHYLKQSVKNIILVSFEKGVKYEEVWPKKVGVGAECYTNHQDHLLESVVKDVDYCIVKVVIVDQTLKAQVFRDIVGKWSHTSVTIIFRKFGPWFSQENGEKCLSVGDNYINALYHPSARVLRDVERYKELYLNPGNPVAVMMRVEHILHNNLNLTKCLNDLVGVTNSVQAGRGEQDNIPMVAVDFGKYGSNSWNWYTNKGSTFRNKAIKDSKEALQVIIKNKMSFVDWEDSFTRVTGDKVNAGYIAAVQRIIASRAECLVLMGGGDFQELVLRDYLEFHLKDKTKCVHFVCVDNERKLRNFIATVT